MPPEPGGSAQLPLAPVPRRYQVHLPGSCSACQRGGGSALPYPQPARACTARGPLGQLKGCLCRAARCHPPLPLLAPLHPAQMPPLAALHPLMPGTDPERNLLSNGANPGPLPRLLPLCTRGAGGCGLGGAGLAPLGLFIAGAPPSTHPCTHSNIWARAGGARAAPTAANTNKCSLMFVSLGLPVPVPGSQAAPLARWALVPGSCHAAEGG